MKLLGLVGKFKPINKDAFIKDWIDGMTWVEMRRKYNIQSYHLFQLAKELDLPCRRYGPVPAKNISAALQRYEKLKPELTKDYIDGMSIRDIMKKYTIGYLTFRPFVKRFNKARKANMKFNRRKKRIEKSIKTRQQDMENDIM